MINRILVGLGRTPFTAVAENYRPIKTVLMALNGTMESAKSIRDCIQLNPRPGVNIHMVHFKNKKDSDPFLLHKAADFCQAHGFDVKPDLVEGSPRSNQMSYAMEHKVDLIVMGNSSSNIIKRRLLGDTLLELIHTTKNTLVPVSVR